MIAQSVAGRGVPLAPLRHCLIPFRVIGRRLQSLSLAFLLLPLAIPAVAGPQDETPGELRGVWIVRTALVSPEAVDKVVDDAASAGLNALLSLIHI